MNNEHEYNQSTQDLFYSQPKRKPVFKNPFKLQQTQNAKNLPQLYQSQQQQPQQPTIVPDVPSSFRMPQEQSQQKRSYEPLLTEQDPIFSQQKPRSQFTQPSLQLETPQVLTVQNPDGTTLQLKPVREIPEKYRKIFPFAYFNKLQSKVFDKVMYSDNPIVICSPTGSGKTALFELAIIRLLLRQQQNTSSNYRVVYMAPIKALCSERFTDWQNKFSPYGLRCTKLTGDTDLDDFEELRHSNIVFTTPEKWDSMTRKWKDRQALVQSVRLFMIDEVHLLNDSSRGATMEAVVSRMKTVQVSAHAADTPAMRFVAVSATIPNVDDIAAWLDTGILPAFGISLGSEYRPVPLRKVVLGYPCSEKQSDFKFNLTLSYKVSSVVQTYSENKPSLVFCCTRKGAMQACGILVKDARFVMNAQHRQRLIKCSNTIHDHKLQDYVLHGCAFHHAGLDASDRQIIEEMFIQGELPVLFCTSTLAMGVNLPAHLVIVKGTMHYEISSYVEYSEAQVLQMIGRAGRPQFDTSATAVIMTKKQTKERYEHLMTGTQRIESSLHHHLTEHINAEIVLGTIVTPEVAQEWLKSTFLYRRIQQNPKHYGAPEGLDKEALGKKLQAMCVRALKQLQSLNLLTANQQQQIISTETGTLMARYYINFETLKLLSESCDQESLEQLVVVLSKVEEFKDISIRQNEKKVLNTLNKDKNKLTIRYPMSTKIKSTHMKINCLIQASLGALSINEFSLTQDISKIFRIGQRVARFAMEYFLLQGNFRTALNSIILCKSIRARMWENSKFVARQLERIGTTMASALVNAGLTTFQRILDTNPREIELILNRNPPFGSQIHEMIEALPKTDVIIEQDDSATVLVKVLLLNETGVKYQLVLLVGDADNRIVFKQKLTEYHLQSGSWSRKLKIERASKSSELSFNLINLQYVGLDVQSSYTPKYTRPLHPPPRPLTNTGKGHLGDKRKAQGCSHKCANKLLCGHQCCKTILPAPPPSLNASLDASTTSKSTKRKRETQRMELSTPKVSEMERFCHELSDRKLNFPNVKKVKVELTLKTASCNDSALEMFSYKPKKKIQKVKSDGGYLSQVSHFQSMREGDRSTDDIVEIDDEDDAVIFDEDFYKDGGEPLPFVQAEVPDSMQVQPPNSFAGKMLKKSTTPANESSGYFSNNDSFSSFDASFEGGTKLDVYSKTEKDKPKTYVASSTVSKPYFKTQKPENKTNFSFEKNKANFSAGKDKTNFSFIGKTTSLDENKTTFSASNVRANFGLSEEKPNFSFAIPSTPLVSRDTSFDRSYEDDVIREHAEYLKNLRQMETRQVQGKQQAMQGSRSNIGISRANMGFSQQNMEIRQPNMDLCRPVDQIHQKMQAFQPTLKTMHCVQPYVQGNQKALPKGNQQTWNSIRNSWQTSERVSSFQTKVPSINDATCYEEESSKVNLATDQSVVHPKQHDRFADSSFKRAVPLPADQSIAYSKKVAYSTSFNCPSKADQSDAYLKKATNSSSVFNRAVPLKKPMRPLNKKAFDDTLTAMFAPEKVESDDENLPSIMDPPPIVPFKATTAHSNTSSQTLVTAKSFSSENEKSAVYAMNHATAQTSELSSTFSFNLLAKPESEALAKSYAQTPEALPHQKSFVRTLATKTCPSYQSHPSTITPFAQKFQPPNIEAVGSQRKSVPNFQILRNEDNLSFLSNPTINTSVRKDNVSISSSTALVSRRYPSSTSIDQERKQFASLFRQCNTPSPSTTFHHQSSLLKAKRKIEFAGSRTTHAPWQLDIFTPHNKEGGGPKRPTNNALLNCEKTEEDNEDFDLMIEM